MPPFVGTTAPPGVVAALITVMRAGTACFSGTTRYDEHNAEYHYLDPFS
jgi:hypothetical protein